MANRDVEKIRIKRSPETDKKLAGVKIKCGCCQQKFYIYIIDDKKLEIAGVVGTIEEWRELFKSLGI